MPDSGKAKLSRGTANKPVKSGKKSCASTKLFLMVSADRANARQSRKARLSWTYTAKIGEWTD